MKIYAYTRQYATETGAAMHLALMDDSGRVTCLNHGFGVLFPKADLNEGFDGRSKGMVQPWLFRTREGDFGVVALRRNVSENGEELPMPEKGLENTVLLFRSHDLTAYEELGMFPAAPTGQTIEDVRCCWDGKAYRLQTCCGGVWSVWTSDHLGGFVQTEETMPIVPRPEAPEEVWDATGVCALEITAPEAHHLLTRLTPPKAPENHPHFPSFAFTPPRGDPMAIRWQNGYLYMATDDEKGQRTLKIRYADHLTDIPKAQDHIIFRANDSGDYSGCLWAPELHWVGGRLCIFFAAGMPHWYTVQSRVMWLTGDDPLQAESWSKPVRMERQNGGHLTDDGITLDMTVVPSGERSYVIWSQRPIRVREKVECGTADLMIAQLNTREPWRLASEPVTLSRPEYGWERIHSPVNEGPFLLRRGSRLLVTYACALIDHTYAVGLLEAQDGDDLSDISVWRKSNYPLLHRLSMKTQLGAGHNAFVKDELGRDILLIHAISMQNYLHDPKDGRRYPCMRMVVWDEEDFPHLDVE